jgi:proline racemase
LNKVFVVDSHTGGEPTRVVVDPPLDLGSGSLVDQAERFRTMYDDFRAGVVLEPRGSDVLVGALLLPALHPGSIASTIFFNNVGTLGMCGHGLIGLMRTLHHLGRITPGAYRIDTPVGTVTAELQDDLRVRVTNVPSYREEHQLQVDVPGFGPVVGDVAWGGNWFFLTTASPVPVHLAHVEALTDFAWRVRQALPPPAQKVDHVELIAPAQSAENNARNFVLCPGKAYDRSPCGTGTSAKVACLAAEGKLAPGEIWRQESITGSVFEASYTWADGQQIIPTITGSASITAETHLIFEDNDPLRAGIRS